MTIIKELSEIKPVRIEDRKKASIDAQILRLRRKITPYFRNKSTTEIIRRMREMRYGRS